MLHFLPVVPEVENAASNSEAVARVASIRTALGIAEQMGGLAPTRKNDEAVLTVWPDTSEARRRCFDNRSVEAAQAAAAGLELLAAQQAAGTPTHPRSVERFALILRTDLASLDKLLSL